MSLEIVLTVLIAGGLIVCVTVDYVRSLGHNRKSLAHKTWDWIKNVLDVLWGL